MLHCIYGKSRLQAVIRTCTVPYAIRSCTMDTTCQVMSYITKTCFFWGTSMLSFFNLNRCSNNVFINCFKALDLDCTTLFSDLLVSPHANVASLSLCAVCCNIFRHLCFNCTGFLSQSPLVAEQHHTGTRWTICCSVDPFLLHTVGTVL